MNIFVFRLQEQSIMKPSVDALLVTVVLSTYLVDNTYANKILLVPTNMNSHVLYFSRLGVDLAKLGNDMVTVIAPSNARVPDFATGDIENFTNLKYPVDTAKPFANSPEASEKLIAMSMTTSTVQLMKMIGEFNLDMVRHGEKYCMQLLDNIQMMRRIREAGYDFAIMDINSGLSCYYTIPYSLGIPYATMSMVYCSPYLFRVPRLSPFPNIVSFTDRPSFLERLVAFIVELIDPGLLTDNKYFVEKYVPDRPHLDTVELFRRQSLWFFLEDLSVDHALPYMPNTVAVGDIMAGVEQRPLSDEIREFVSRAKHGVIVVGFGSYCDFFPPAITRQLCEAFTEVTTRFRLSVIWKLKDKGVCSNDNILILPWIPQNDLLADSRVKLFISHGGLNSLIESIYHSKPLIIFPLGLDQPGNAAAAESKGFAIQMNIADFSPESLVSNIHKLLTDLTYKRNASLASAIMRDRRDTPAQRVSAMIDHVIKYGDRHLRTGAFELSTFQFMMFDIFAALVAAAALVLLVVTLCCCCVYHHCFRRGTSSHEKLK